MVLIGVEGANSHPGLPVVLDEFDWLLIFSQSTKVGPTPRVLTSMLDALRMDWIADNKFGKEEIGKLSDDKKIQKIIIGLDFNTK